uniref:Protein kinase domain-containing protein n=1 Tax=Leersia perrieri TaxID=77586 RepID=A0A0D9VES3_9ORYZ
MEPPENELKAREDVQRHVGWILDNNPAITKFTEDDIRRITSNYSTPIGRGGYGEVFRGVLDDEDDVVAVKRYIHKKLREHFLTEVSIHSQINHKNAVKLKGYYLGGNTLIIVTEYMSNGNLDDALQNSSISIPLSTRLGIAIDCAEALSFMHSMHLSNGSPVCHGDIKPENILLATKLTAKVADFGLSRSLLGGIIQYTSHVKGSFDYMDPIYFQQRRRLIPKSDVYSFVAVLLELISRKRSKDRSSSLIGTFTRACAKGRGITELCDAGIANTSNIKVLEEIAKLATKCLTLDTDRQPQMNDVAKYLHILRDRMEGQEKTAWPFFWEHNNNIKSFTEHDIERITLNYSTLLGKDQYGEVYKGVIHDDNTAVAVKRYIQEDLREQFMAEESIHGQINHENAVKLVGYCIGENALMLVTEYISNGCTGQVILRSYDEKIGQSPASGSLAYMDPIYLQEGRLTPKCDIYSFGVVLLELIARKRIQQGELNLIGAFSKACANKEGLRELFDTEIAKRTDIKILEEISKLATECLTLDIDRRPKIYYVVEHLKMLKVQIKGQEKSAGPFFQRPKNHEIQIFAEKDIERITGNYSTPIGRGAFREVFRGFLENEDDIVAVKRYIYNISREEFMKERASGNEKVLRKLFDAEISNGDNMKILKEIAKLATECLSLDIDRRPQINYVTENLRIFQAQIKGQEKAAGPFFQGPQNHDIKIFTEMDIQRITSNYSTLIGRDDSIVCHGDIRPGNIFLDASLTAKVTDFWNAKLLLGGLTCYTSSVMGSIDYMDPILLREGRITPARKRTKEGQVSLIEAFSGTFAKEKGFNGLFDAEIANMGNVKILEDIAKLAIKCLTLEIDRRPQINDVAKHLLVLWKSLRGGEGLPKLDIVRIFTKVELSEVTENYSHLLGIGPCYKVYKGTLEDNTVVTVKKYSVVNETTKEECSNAAMILSQIVHKNIIRLLGCCFEDKITALVCEYAAKGKVSDILDGGDDFPLELRLKIAAKTAEALEYLHEPTTGANIFLGDNFMPKFTGFANSRRLSNV